MKTIISLKTTFAFTTNLHYLLAIKTKIKSSKEIKLFSNIMWLPTLPCVESVEQPCVIGSPLYPAWKVWAVMCNRIPTLPYMKNVESFHFIQENFCSQYNPRYCIFLSHRNNIFVTKVSTFCIEDDSSW